METLRLSKWRGSCSVKSIIFHIYFSAVFVIVTTNKTPQPMSDDTAISLSEDTPIGTVIGNISAYDTDGPQDVTFRISSSDKLTSKLVELKNYRSVGADQYTWAMDIVLKDQLDRDYQPSIRKLTFTATDGQSQIALEVSLMIQDVNDVKPLLLNLPYKVTIPENQTVDSVVFSNVSALDPDNGRGSSVEYTLTTDAQGANDEYRSTFEISSTNGKIYLKKRLDYEKRSFYIFKVGLKDKGDPPLQGDPADFVVTVLDVQDTPPMFVNLPYNTEIKETETVGTSVLRVTGIDGDQGIPNELSYSFVSGDYSNFAIDSSTGWITVKSALDRDSASMANNGGVYAMWVQATEIDKPDQVNYGNTTAKALVTISVQDVNDNRPEFMETQYTAQIQENMQKGVPITFLGDLMRVGDNDQGTNSHFSLTVEKGGQPYLDFTTLPAEVYAESTVLVRVNNSQALDYEAEKQIVFQVVARELDTAEKRSSTATVTLNILDMNDNAPNFTQSQYLFSVPENATVDYSIGTIHATDDDTGSFGSVSYSLRGDNEKFRVDSVSGVLYVQEKLDRETTSHYYLSAEAIDGGGNRAPTEIEIVVTDINDNAPLFRRRDYEGVVQEKSATFLRPIVVEAIDDDQPLTPNSQVYYRIDRTPSGLESNFHINSSTGDITLTEPLDYEQLDPGLQGKIQLKVWALDRGNPQKSSSTFVNITVEDVNDFPPVFSESSYSKHINENSPQDMLVVTVSATDDDGTDPNNDFFYRIESGALDKFRINFGTGEIFVESGAKLDREEKQEYTLRVSATDRGNPPLTGSSSVVIILDNVNDEMPRFAESSQSTTIPENWAVGRSVFSYPATDSDDDSNLRYSLLTDLVKAYDQNEETLDAAATGVNNYFDVFANNGTIYVHSELDRETAERIIVKILAEDLNATDPPQQSSTATLTITLSDYNDNPPQFDLSGDQYSVNVSEAENINSVILRVFTTDEDRGQQVTYELEPSDAGASEVTSFRIVADTGTVILTQKLDRETQPSRTFRIVAKDSGVPQQSSSATVSITVTDENDNIPKFETYPTVFTVPEDAGVGYEVHVLKANDDDAGDFGKVVYSLEGVDSGDGKFEIDADTGRLTVARELDREEKGEYRLEVLARDSDPDQVNRKSTRAPLTILVGDVNDNRPQFQAPPATPSSVAEIAEVDKSIFTVTASDDDSGDNGTVEFSLTSDTNATAGGANLFSIESSTGIVRVAQALLRKAAVYSITVEASDKGKERLSSTESFIIEVYDVNDVYPEFVDPNPNNPVVYISEDAAVGSVVHRLSAEDADTGRNGLVAYTLDPQQDAVNLHTFRLNASSGDLATKVLLDRETRNEYQVKVRATDHGIPRNFSTELTLVVRVRDVNDQPPMFDRQTLSTPYVVKLRENDTTQGCVGVNVAEDKDTEVAFTTICYYLKGAELGGVFQLDTSGSLCLQEHQMLDREVTPFTNLVVQASDDCNQNVPTVLMTPSYNQAPELYSREDMSLLWVKVNVTDVNDFRPVFVRGDLALGITRDVQVGKIIYDLKYEVIDEDTEKWGVSHFINLTAFEAHPTQLARELQDLKVTSPFKLFQNGSVAVNTYFNADMSGYFIVSVRVLDKGGLQDDARLRISLISDNQRLKVVFREGVAQVGTYRVAFAQRMSAVTGYRIVVDKVQTHENEKGVAETDKTDVFIHGENKNTNEIVPAVVLLQTIDEWSADVMMIRLLNDFNILEIVETRSLTKDDEEEKKLRMALILVSIILGVLCIILAVALYFTYKRYSRKLKAATALAYANGVGSQETDLYKVDLPGTNMHTYEKPSMMFEGQTRF